MDESYRYQWFAQLVEAVRHLGDMCLRSQCCVKVLSPPGSLFTSGRLSLKYVVGVYLGRLAQRRLRWALLLVRSKSGEF